MHRFKLLSMNIKAWILVLMLMLASTQIVMAAYNIPPSSEQAIELADNIIAWQTNSGGWTKNTDFTRVTWQPGMEKGPINRLGQESGTFDNDASIDEMRFLASVYQATGITRYKDSFMRGLDWMLEAQYPSGGWPQYYPLRNGYWDNVTFNDNAMARILDFVQEMLDQRNRYDFIDQENLARLQDAYSKGIDYILKSQIEVNGHLTAWCQQHDPVTYEPRMGRTYEHPSIVSSESVPIVRFLMSLRDPSEEVRRAILSAIDWFSISQLPDGRWARFYDIKSNVPIFSGRDGIIRYNVNDIEEERQTGYSWYNSVPSQLFMILDHREGYVEQLRNSLPDYEPPTIDIFADPAIPKFNSPRIMPAQTVQGDLPISIEFMMRNPQNFEQVVLKVSNQEFYRDNQMEVNTTLNTRELINGYYILTAETTTKEDVYLSHSVQFVVDNPEEEIEIPFSYFDIDNGLIEVDETASTGIAVWVNSVDFEAKKSIRLHPGTYTVEVWMKISQDKVNELGRSFGNSDAIELAVENAHIRTYHDTDYDGDYGTNPDRALTFTVTDEQEVELRVYATDEIGMLLDRVVIRN